MIGGVSYSEIVDNLMSTKLSLPHIDGAPVHPIVGAILHKAVQRDPAKRYESAGEMKGQLDRFRVDRGEGSETPDADHSTVQFLLRPDATQKGLQRHLRTRLGDVADYLGGFCGLGQPHREYPGQGHHALAARADDGEFVVLRRRRDLDLATRDRPGRTRAYQGCA